MPLIMWDVISWQMRECVCVGDLKCLWCCWISERRCTLLESIRSNYQQNAKSDESRNNDAPRCSMTDMEGWRRLLFWYATELNTAELPPSNDNPSWSLSHSDNLHKAAIQSPLISPILGISGGVLNQEKNVTTAYCVRERERIQVGKRGKNYKDRRILVVRF